MTSEDTASSFYIFINGHIESAEFSLESDATDLFCRYELVAGPDWQLISGSNGGITQIATDRNKYYNRKIVFNMPIEVTYKSRSPFGWPQIVISIFGKNRMKRDTLLGYCRGLLPVFGGQLREDSAIVVPILRPKTTNMVLEIENWITSRQPELKNPKMLVDATQQRGLFFESYGEVKIQLGILMKGASALGYEWTL